MGCDIHIVLEKEHKGKWVGIRSYEWLPGDNLRVLDPGSNTQKISSIGWQVRARNYELFAALAGVRGYGPEPKGLPEDASDLTLMKRDEWGGDGHSDSYGLLSEVGITFLVHQGRANAVVEETRKQAILTLFGVDEWEDNIDLDQYRVVYWFDN